MKRRHFTAAALLAAGEATFRSASGQMPPAETRSVRDAPAVVTVVTREEIRRSGARDLVDVLRMVSGFDFGVDVWGVIGVGFRGHWGQEAKIMLAIDGLVLDELMYGHRDLRGGPLAGQPCASYGAALGSESYLGVSAFGAAGRQSPRTHTDIFGDSFDMGDDHDLRAANLGLRYRRGSLRAQFHYDDYRTTFRDGYDEILPASIGADFTSYLGDVSWSLTPRPSLTITPALKGKVVVRVSVMTARPRRSPGRASACWPRPSWGVGPESPVRGRFGAG